MLETNVIVRELSKMNEQDFAKFLKKFMKDIKVKQFIFERQELLESRIKKFSNVLTFAEQNMLRTLNDHCLLLSIDYEIDFFGKKSLVAYDLSGKVILRK